MRNAVGIFGLVCGAVIVGIVGRYGFKTTDVEVDAWIMAFFFAVIATAGLGGHAVAARLWGLSKAASIAMAIVCGAALMLNLANSLGAIAGRQDKATMERVATNRDIRAAEAELKRLTELRDAMPAFAVTDQDSVDAAKRTRDTAASRRKAECGENNEKRGSKCKDREEDETKAAEAVTKTATARAQTARAMKLEADAQTQRDKLTKLGPVVVINIQGSAITKLFRLPDSEAEFAAMAQQFGMAAIAELIVVLCLVSWEILGHAVAAARPSTNVPAKTEALAPTRSATSDAPVVDAEIAEGDPGTFLSTSLKPGEAVKEDDVCLAYELWCAAHGCMPIPREKFKTAFVMLCMHSGFRRSRGKVYGMQLVGSKRAPRLGKMSSIREAGESV